MSPHTPPKTPSTRSGQPKFVRTALVLILTVAVVASSVLMVGPQIVLIVPVAL